jgi:hypothetical protein
VRTAVPTIERDSQQGPTPDPGDSNDRTAGASIPRQAVSSVSAAKSQSSR